MTSASLTPSMEGTHSFETVIGLEIHAQIVSQSKLFSSASTQVFGQEPNTCVTYLDVAMPGMLPTLNRHCVDQAIRLGLAIDGTIKTTSIMDRKHYFYPDNPAGYQISQYRFPLIEEGTLDIKLKDQPTKTIRIQRIHIEQDAGKSLHDQDPTCSYVDFNRAGIGLMEIVSHPDLSSADEVVDYVKRLRALMRALGVCHGDMEKGQLRIDANVSVRRPNEPLGTRVEIKNMNSLKFLHQAIQYEVKRQVTTITQGQTITQETRTFDTVSGTTKTMRTKETADDYCYFPDPDLHPVIIDAAHIQHLKDTLPETPAAKRHRMITEYHLSDYDADILTAEQEVTEYFQSTVEHLGDPALIKQAANWIMGELFALYKKANDAFESNKVPPAYLASLIQAVARKTVSSLAAKDVLAHMYLSGQNATQAIEHLGLALNNDEATIQGWVQAVLDKEADKVTEYLQGKDKLLGYFVGQAMKESKGKGDPQMLGDRIKQALNAMR